MGIGGFLLVWAPGALIAGGVGIWLFYVQHQFEDAYWQRTGLLELRDSALRGSSFLDLPKPLQFATGNIGYHHIHHLSVRIPNYTSSAPTGRTRCSTALPTLSLADGLRAVRLKLWDEQTGRLVTFEQAQHARRPYAGNRGLRGTSGAWPRTWRRRAPGGSAES